MKNYLYWKILVSIVILLNFHFSNAQQPFGIPIYKNCYQKVQGGLNGGQNIFRFINNKDGRRIKMSSTNPLDIQEFKVTARKYGDDIWNPLTSLEVDSSLVVGFLYESIIIYPVASIGTIGLNYSSTEIKFVDFDFELNSNSSEPPCLTFSNFNFNINHNLDGLCKIPLITLKVPPGSIQTWGLGNNFFMEMQENQGYTIPINEEFCEENNCYNNSELVSCCFNFNFELTLYPCEGELNCPPLTFTKQLPVCCWCGSIGPED